MENIAKDKASGASAEERRHRGRRRRLWAVIGIETFVLIALAAWVLTRLDRLLEPTALLVGAAIVVAGDVVTAAVMQKLAPSRIVVRPGEDRGDSAVATADFDADGRGLVSLRGERWNARALNRTDRPETIRRGDRVFVHGRDGLTLLVEPVDRERQSVSRLSNASRT